MVELLLPDEHAGGGDDADGEQDRLEGPEATLLQPGHAVAAAKEREEGVIEKDPTMVRFKGRCKRTYVL